MTLKKSANLVYQQFDLSKKFFSKEEDSPFAILSDDIINLDNPRPLGLSGHLRAKNESSTIGLAIESSIEALDELIITVQPSDDDTYEICQEKFKKYPDKIKLYYYTPEVVPNTRSHCFEGYKEQNGDNTSIHNFAHYNNFGLVKITYKYYMKIDADQVYFTSKLKDLKEAIIKADKYSKLKRNLFNKVLGRMTRPFYNFLCYVLSLETFIKWMTIFNGKCAYGLCGINLTSEPMGGGGNNPFKYKGLFFTFKD